MLSEFLNNAGISAQTEWQTVMNGVSVCRFSLKQPEGGFPVTLPVEQLPMHYEALFCCTGSMLLGRKHGKPIAVGRQDVLLLSNVSSLHSARITAPLEGILLSVDAVHAGESLGALSSMMGGLKIYTTQLKQMMDEQEGCTLVPVSAWSRSVFATLEGLPPVEQGRYCALKTTELLYLLCTRSSQLEIDTDAQCSNSYLARTVSDMQAYKQRHLGEKLTIEAMSHRLHISPTAFKSCFRRLYGQPVHSWLLEQRMKRAAEFLHSSPMTILQISQAVGYEGVSQFNVAFKHRYGVTPRQYRKMSDPGDI